MNNNQFANALALATEKGKINKSKRVAEFIEKYNGTSDGDINLDGEVTAEIKEFASKLPHNLKIKEPMIKEVLASASMSSVDYKEPSTRTSTFKAQEW